jgi:RecA-family ATPase
MITYGSHAKKLIDNGYYIIPIVPNLKRPAIRDWTNPENYNSDPAKYQNCGIGIICGYGGYPVYGVDVDVTDEELSAIDLSAPLRVGLPPKKLFVFRGPTAGIAKRASKRYDCGRIEVIGAGCQFVAFGIHPDARRPYSWPGSSPLDVPAAALPLLPDVGEIFARYENVCELSGLTPRQREGKTEHREYDPNDPLYIKPPLEISVDEIKKMLDSLDPDCGRDQWRNVGFALHHQFDGDETGYELWDSWSAGGSKYKDGECRYQWDSFGHGTGEPLTMAYIKKLITEIPVATIPETSSDSMDFFDREWSPSRFVDNPTPIDMIVTGMIPKSVVGIIYSAGGAGKSTLVLDLVSRVAMANDQPVTWLGESLVGGSAVVLTAEDPDEVLNHRYMGIVKAITADLSTAAPINMHEVRSNIEKNLKLVSTFGVRSQLFTMRDGELKPTKFFVQFRDYLKKLNNLQLIVIDTKTRFSPAEEEGNVITSDEIAYYEYLTRETGATILLLHHTNKMSRNGSQDGQQAYRGNTALFDTSRVSFFLRPLTSKEIAKEEIDPEISDEYFYLENSKNNYIRRHKTLLIHRNEYSYTAREAYNNPVKKELSVRNDLLIYLQATPEKEQRQAEILLWGQQNSYGRTRVLSAVEELIQDGLINFTVNGRAKYFILTAAGREYNLTMEENGSTIN